MPDTYDSSSSRGCRRRALLATVLGLSTLLSLHGASASTSTCPTCAEQAGKPFSGDLSDCNFSNQTCDKANFTGVTLNGAIFNGASLKSADFTQAKLGVSKATKSAASFTGADLTHANFFGATISSAEFQFADLSCAIFDHTELTTSQFGPIVKLAPTSKCRTSFKGATLGCEFIPQWKDLEMTNAGVQNCEGNLKNRDFSGSKMSRVIFSGMNISGSTWVGSDLSQAFFLQADISYSDFSGADMTQAQLSRADGTKSKFTNQTKLTGAFLSGIKLANADMTGAVLHAADGFPAADLSLAYMPNVILTDAEMAAVNMSYTSFYGANAKADNATLQEVRLSNANLGSVNLSQGKMKGIVLDGASLINSVLTGADLTRSSLVSANLQGADFSGARLYGANLSNAAVALDKGVSLFEITGAPATQVKQSLDQCLLTHEVATAFSTAGYPLLVCSNPIKVLVVTAGKTWSIVSNIAIGQPPYNEFRLTKTGGYIEIYGIGEMGRTKLFQTSQSFADALDTQGFPLDMLATFSDNKYPLPPCENPMVTVRTAGSKWRIDETLSSITSPNIGYTGFTVIANSNALDVHGTAISIVRPGADGQLELQVEDAKKTNLTIEAFNDNTTCPNGQSYGANKKAGLPWAKMMTAPKPPTPPHCIPSPTHWCP